MYLFSEVGMEFIMSKFHTKNKERSVYLPPNLPSDQPITAPWGPPIIPESKISVIMKSIE